MSAWTEVLTVTIKMVYRVEICVLKKATISH